MFQFTQFTLDLIAPWLAGSVSTSIIIGTYYYLKSMASWLRGSQHKGD